MIPTFGIWSLEKSFHFLRNMVWTFQCFFGFCFQKYFGMTFVGSYCSFIFSAISFKLYRLYLQFQFSLFYFILVGTLCCSSEKKAFEWKWMENVIRCDALNRVHSTHIIFTTTKKCSVLDAESRWRDDAEKRKKTRNKQKCLPTVHLAHFQF